MISGIAIRNFKAIGSEGVVLELKPLTILVGPNGSGKSSILESLALISQSIDDALRIDGELIRYPSYESIFHKKDAKKPLQIHIKIKLIEAEVNDLYTKIHNAQINVRADPQLTYTYSHTRYEDNIVTQTIMIGDNTLASASVERVMPRSLRYKLSFPILGVEGRYRDAPTKVLNPRSFQTDSISGADLENFNLLIETILSYFTARLQRKIFMLYSTRGRMEHTMPASTDNYWVGNNGEYLIPILAKIFSKDEYRRIANKIADWADKFGIANLKAGWWQANTLGSDFTDPELQTNLNTALAGHGSRQALTMIAQIFWSKPDDILLIEEPEISLHPDAQARLPELFAQAIKEGKTILTTTHSEFLLLALSRPIREGLIKPTDIAVYFCHKDPHKGTQIDRLEVSEQGYVKGWVPSFASIERELLKEFLETVPKE